jgi:hypothetical protein
VRREPLLTASELRKLEINADGKSW